MKKAAASRKAPVPVAPAKKAVPAKKAAAAKIAEHKAEEKERTAFFTSGRFPRIKIDISPEDIEKLKKEPREYVVAQITEDGKTVYKDVAIHLRGSAGSFRP